MVLSRPRRARSSARIARSALAAAALAAGLAGGAPPSAAAPQACSPRDRKAAEKLADQGFEHFEAADYKAAIGSFGEAEARCHSPRLVVFLARTHARLGQLLRARELLQQTIDEPLTPRSPGSFREAQVEARKELEALKPRIPVLQALITGAPPDSVQVKLDGASLDPAEIVRGRDVDPGEHTLAAEAPGHEPVVRHLVVRESVVERLEIGLRPIAAATEAPPPSERPSLAPPIAAFVVGAAGLGVGAVTGVLSASAVSDIKSRCSGNQCLRADAEEGDRAALLGNVSTVGFAVGGAGVAVGVLLLLLRSDPAPPPPASGALRVEIGPGSLGLGGTF